MDKIFDCVIVGGGAAGLSAALTLGRSKLSVALVDDGSPINKTVEHSHGYLTRDGASPSDFVRIGRTECKVYGVEFIDERAESVTAALDWVVVTTTDRTIEGKRLLLATGARYELPAIPGLQEAWGVGAAACPFCHAWEWRDSPLGILLGNEDHAAHLLKLLPRWSDDLTVYTNGGDGDGLSETGAKMVREPISKLVLDGRQVVGIRTSDDRLHPCGGLFFAALPTPNDALTRQLSLELADNGYPVVDAMGQTSNELVWCTGNATTPATNLITSAAAGSMAAVSIVRTFCDFD